ncbi:hypothetical protein AB0478_46450, partial [Streptomyces sp. NPDC051917]
MSRTGGGSAAQRIASASGAGLLTIVAQYLDGTAESGQYTAGADKSSGLVTRHGGTRGGFRRVGFVGGSPG